RASSLIAAALAIVALGVFASPAHAQGSRKDDIVFGPAGHPVAGATVTVCQATATGTPCSPHAVIYTDATLSVPAANPFQTDGIGNYHFYAPAGRYMVQISGGGITGTKTYPDVILPPDTSSTGSGNNISAFGLTLGGNLNVAGNANISGTLTTSNFNPGTFSPTSLAVGGNESVIGPRPRVDVTAYGAKGDGSTDDTAAIQAAINAVCNSTSGGGTIYFPPATGTSGVGFSYKVSQPQTPSTASVFSVGCNIHIEGDATYNNPSGQFGRAPQTAIIVVAGANPNAAPVFGLGFGRGNASFDNISITGYNEAVSLYDSVQVEFRNTCLIAQNTGMADNTPLKITNSFWIWMKGGCLQTNGSGTVPIVKMTGEASINSEAPLVGLLFFDGVLGAGGGIQYVQRVNSFGSGPGNWVFRNMTVESSGTDFLTITNASGNPGSAALPFLTAITFDHASQSDSTLPAAAVLNLNSSGTTVSGVNIFQSYAGTGTGVAIRVTAGTLNDFFVTNCQVVCQNAVVDANNKPVGGGVVQSGAGFDYVSDMAAADRLRSDLNPLANGLSGINSPQARFVQSGSAFANLAIDPVAGFLFNNGLGYGFNAALQQNSLETVDLAFAQTLPPTSVAGAAASGGSLANGTYYYVVRATPDNCTHVSAPSLPSAGVALTGSNGTINLTWTLPMAGAGTVAGYCITRGAASPAVAQQAGYILATGGSTASYTDTGTSMVGGNMNPVNTLQSTHRFTPTSLGINTTSPQFNLDVNGSAEVNSLNSVQMAERFSGADAAQKINACLTAASTSSSVCDARGLTGTLTATHHITIPAGTVLLWGQAQLTISDTTTNDAVELIGDGALLHGYQESGIGTSGAVTNSGYIACGVSGCTAVKNPNQATAKINYVHIDGMYLISNGTAGKVIDMTSIGHSTIENNNLVLGSGGNGYGIFGDTSTGNFDSTNTKFYHNNFQPQNAGDICMSLAGVFNAVVIEQNTCILPHTGGSVIGFQFKKDSHSNYPNNDEVYGNDCESSGPLSGQLCFNVINAKSVTWGPNNRCEKVYACFQFPVDGSATGVHFVDTYLSLSNTNQLYPNEPSASQVAVDNTSENWLPSMHYGLSDESGPNLLANAGFEGWQNSTTLFYWGGVSGTSVNLAGSGIYAQQSSASAPVDGYTQGSSSVVIGDNATAGLGVNSGCIQVDATMNYTLAFRVASTSTSVNFRPGFRFYSDPNCTEGNRITSVSSNARVLQPVNYAGRSALVSVANANWQSTNASLTYNNGITCNCNVTGADWNVSAANAWTPTRNFAITFRVPNAGYTINETQVAHSMRVFLLENTAANPNQLYFDDIILSQGSASQDIRPAALSDSGNGGTVNAYSNYNFAGTIALQSNTAFTGTFSHSNTANRTYTLPDASGTLVVQTSAGPWGLQHAGSAQSFTSNTVKVWGIVIPYGVSFSHIDYDVATLDSNGSDNYDVGLYGPCPANTSSCPLVTHIGAQNLTSTGYKQASVTSGTIQAGTYWIAITGNATTAQVATTSVSEWTACPSSNSSTASSGGALPSTIATPNCSAPQWTGQAVVSIGLE
ncbi:MAG: glycosyl hydrolase family 28-related protein, partial [Candidatus Acidiferrales bacterium]